MSPIRWFKAVALVEAVSYLVLLAASLAKHLLDAQGLVTVVGPAHGVVFLVYLALALNVREQLGWDSWTTMTVVVAAVVPLGGLMVERRLPDAVAATGAPGASGSDAGAGCS